MNDTDIGAFSGGASLVRANNKSTEWSAGVAGSVAVNVINNKTEAAIVNSTVNEARDVDVYALIGGENLAVALGTALNVSSDQSTAGEAAGSASVSVGCSREWSISRAMDMGHSYANISRTTRQGWLSISVCSRPLRLKLSLAASRPNRCNSVA